MPEGIIRIIVGLAALLVGWAIGFFDSKMRADKKIRQAEEKAQIAIEQAKGEADRVVKAARSAAESAPPPLTGKTLLRLWLDSLERPALDLDGQSVETSPMAEPNRKRLLSLLNLMRPWIENRPAAPAPTPVSVPRPAAAPVSRPAAAPAAKNEKPVAPLSIVGQIDEILQALLVSSPLVTRAIRLQESPEGGVIVWVGLQKFAGMGEVTDPEVQAILRTAIAEWEKKYTPG